MRSAAYKPQWKTDVSTKSITTHEDGLGYFRIIGAFHETQPALPIKDTDISSFHFGLLKTPPTQHSTFLNNIWCTLEYGKPNLDKSVSSLNSLVEIDNSMVENNKSIVENVTDRREDNQ